MKKILFLALALLSFSQMFADGKTERFASYTFGVNGLFIEHCLESINNWGKDGNNILNAVVAPDFDFTKASSLSIKLQPGFEIVTQIPTDFSAASTSEGVTFSVRNIKDQSVVSWKLFLHKIKKASIPYSLKFGSTNPVNSTDPDFMGWAYRAIDMSNNFPRLSNKSQSFILAFNPCSGSETMTCNFYASNNTEQKGLSANIESSADGISWINLKTFNNDIPKNSARATEKNLSFLLSAGSQYIRFQILTRAATDPTVCMNLFQVGKK